MVCGIESAAGQSLKQGHWLSAYSGQGPQEGAHRSYEYESSDRPGMVTLRVKRASLNISALDTAKTFGEIMECVKGDDLESQDYRLSWSFTQTLPLSAAPPVRVWLSRRWHSSRTEWG
jgi:hypothetical protein